MAVRTVDPKSPLHPTRVLAEVRRRLEAVARPERAAQEKRYLKSTLQFLGATVPQIRAEAARFVREHGTPDAVDLERLATEAWRSGVHELRAFAVIVLERCAGQLGPSDLSWVEALLRQARTWALVDGLAVHGVGPVVAAHPGATHRVLRRWARDEDFWIRRAALLALLAPLRQGGGEWALFCELAVPMLDEREFFIRKAVGWVLREVGRKRPTLTAEFLQQHRARVCGLTLREGAKPLNARQRRALGLSASQ